MQPPRYLSPKDKTIIDIDQGWKFKKKFTRPRASTFERMFMPGSITTRENEDGCMAKVKLE